MALFKDTRTTQEDNSSYIALLADNKETLIGFISPVKGVKKEVLVEKLVEKGLNVELREKSNDDLDFDL